MSGLADLTPGMIGFGPLAGIGNPFVAAGQMILGEGFTVGKLNIGHVFVVTQQADYEAMPGADFEPYAVEAMPGGAIEVAIPERWTSRFAYVRLPEDYPGQAADAAAIARAMIGTPYSFVSYAALAAWRFGWKTPRLERWIDRRTRPFRIYDHAGQPKDIAAPAEAICSVLADQAWALTGKQVMPAGTPHQCVTPGALAKALLEMPGAEWMWP